ncbi:AAEL000537-PA [Aedes aegypti]|uniref:AAEL000537-PA n=1 Tax=Aedes aegypti TaxID=7159 RepID=Q17NY4_AEDAE|nr:AAEL000537-PA [Aedes aegypti]
MSQQTVLTLFMSEITVVPEGTIHRNPPGVRFVPRKVHGGRQVTIMWPKE